MPLITIIIPAYNEERTIAQVARRVEASCLPDGFEREIIIVNDGSTDGTARILDQFEGRAHVVHQANSGKGGAVRAGFLVSHGDFVIVQDADLEQNPDEFPALLQPIIDGDADVVFGSRFMGTYEPATTVMKFHSLLNKLYTFLTNLLIGYRTTDAWTGYKMYSRKALDAVRPHLRSDGIEFELEVAVLLSKCGMRVRDVPISYVPRWYADGKKTDWKQALRSLWKLLGFGLRRIH